MLAVLRNNSFLFEFSFSWQRTVTLLHNQMNWPVNIYCINSYIYFLIKNLYYYFFRIYVTINTYGEPGSSVSMVSGYALDDRTIEVRSLVGQRISSLTSVYRPALGPTQPPVQLIPGVLSPGVKNGRGVTLTTHPHLVPRSTVSRSYTFSSPKCLRGV
jgi:hypothetical protein